MLHPRPGFAPCGESALPLCFRAEFVLCPAATSGFLDSQPHTTLISVHHKTSRLPAIMHYSCRQTAWPHMGVVRDGTAARRCLRALYPNSSTQISSSPPKMPTGTGIAKGYTSGMGPVAS